MRSTFARKWTHVNLTHPTRASFKIWTDEVAPGAARDRRRG